jgi:hypothetical protein
MKKEVAAILTPGRRGTRHGTPSGLASLVSLAAGRRLVLLTKSRDVALAQWRDCDAMGHAGALDDPARQVLVPNWLSCDQPTRVRGGQVRSGTASSRQLLVHP